MKKKAGKESFGIGWVTSDDDERAIRRQRAETERMEVRLASGKNFAPYGDYLVSHDENGERRAYTVELRSLDSSVNTCTCPDFAKNGLGTCKHIERVLLRVGRTEKKAGAQHVRSELFFNHLTGRMAFVRGTSTGNNAFASVSRHFDKSGAMLDPSWRGVESLLATCARINRRNPDTIRISSEVKDRARIMHERDSLAMAVGEFASRMSDSDGKWPFLKHVLYPYQVEGAIHLATKGRAILADEMGLGKTVQAIAAALLMKEVSDVRRVLVIVPTSLKGEWLDQISFFSDARSELLSGGRRERLEQYDTTSAFFLVANYEQVFRDWEDINSRFKPDLVVLDEAQRIKNWTAKTSRRLKRLDARFAFVLTGTPLENRIDEFYSIAEFVDPELFGSIFRFNRAYYRFDEKGKSSGMQNLDDLHEKASRIMLRRRKDLVEDELPNRSDKNYFVKMSKEQSLRYCDFQEKVTRLCGHLKHRPLTKEELERLQRYLACMRMLCDTCYILDSDVRESPKADEALAVLEDIFASDPTRKVVVFSEWVKMLELMEERLVDAGIGFAVHTGSVRQDRRREELRRFRSDPDCRVLLSSESGGVGLNLQAASVVMNLDLPWNPAKLEQRIARAWRKHQHRDVLVINLVASGTIEHKMLSTLKFKQGLADCVLDARGNTADFESEKSKNAFLARVTALMDAQLPAVAKPDGTASAEKAPSMGNAEEVAAGGLSAKELISPESLLLLSKLAKMGMISLGDEAARMVAELEQSKQPEKDTIADLRAKAAEKRRRVAAESLAKARRKAKMAEVLEAGGFADEAASPYREAICIAAGAVFFSSNATSDETADDIPEEAPHAALDNIVAIQDSLALPPEIGLSLQFAVQGKEIPSIRQRTTAFLDECDLLI